MQHALILHDTIAQTTGVVSRGRKEHACLLFKRQPNMVRFRHNVCTLLLRTPCSFQVS